MRRGSRKGNKRRDLKAFLFQKLPGNVICDKNVEECEDAPVLQLFIESQKTDTRRNKITWKEYVNYPGVALYFVGYSDGMVEKALGVVKRFQLVF